RAAAARTRGPLVCAALRAAAERWLAERRRALERACLASALCDAAPCPSRLSACLTARERVREGRRLVPDFAFATSRDAWRLVRDDAVPFFGGASFTPARRALERPMAIACLLDRAPCLPSRT